ncbi:hypothetical protein HYT84_02455, partial [Candidatus Micrarchaeota archaeon]|nr:hypothetical protein [Candidatus Micrarchaeota archaeon]
MSASVMMTANNRRRLRKPGGFSETDKEDAAVALRRRATLKFSRIYDSHMVGHYVVQGRVIQSFNRRGLIDDKVGEIGCGSCAGV